MSRISCVSPYQLQPREAIADEHRQEQSCAVPVLNVCGVDQDEKDQSHRIDEQVPLPSRDILCSVVAPWSSLLGRLDRLAVHDGRTGLLLSSCLLTDHLPEPVVYAGPRTVVGPEPEVPCDRAPRREVVGEVAPLAPCSHDVQD